ncbi:MAG: hypothetical protein KF885_11605 [Anaerolineales bacterium]|nr:hypothetical protein [Anaerolineales bacterium]
MTKLSRYAVLFSFALLLAACAPGTAAGPSAWIDAPLSGSQFVVGQDVEIVLHAGEAGGISAVALSLGDELLATLPNQGSAAFVTLRHTWRPDAAGEYLLSAVAQNRSGEWGQPALARIIILGEEDAPEEPPVAALAEDCTDSAELLSQALPDGRVFAPGQEFTQEWVLRNSGNCTWSTGYKLVFFSGTRANINNPQISLGQNVQPGGSASFSQGLAAPAQPGNYTWLWQLQDEQNDRVDAGFLGTGRIQIQFSVQAPDEEPSGPVGVATTPAPLADTQAPVIYTLHWSPTQPTEDDYLSFSVTAGDNVGVTRIEIYFVRQGQSGGLIHTCQNSNVCTFNYSQPLNAGTYIYSARAYDAAGNQVSSFNQSIQVAAVIR